MSTLLSLLAAAAVPTHWLDSVLNSLAQMAPDGSFFAYGFNLRAMLALVLVALCSGAVGALIVSSRMAFFSDALAHSAYAGVSIGFVVFVTLLTDRGSDEFWDWVTPVMLAFGMLIGFGIAWVRSHTGLASDTVIGIFFAFSIGLTATLSKIMQSRQLFSLEAFLFGDPLLVRAQDVAYLGVLTLLTAGLLTLIFNDLLLAGFNSSLALSRRVPIQFVSYAFVILLAIVVNLCVRTVGVLLINALLVVPAATAANLGRNLRQVFWLTMVMCLGSCLAGQALSWAVESQTHTRLGIPGTVVLINVGLFGISALIGPGLRNQPRLRERVPAAG